MSDQTLHRHLQSAKTDPQQILAYGYDAVAAVGAVAMASLHLSTAASVEEPVNSMADFLEEFAGAKKLVEKYARRRATVAKIQHVIPVLSRFANAHDLRQLAMADGRATAAGAILQKVVPAIHGMENELEHQVLTSQKVSDAYRLIGERIDQLHRVGMTVISEWEKEAAKELVPNIVVAHAESLPFHVTGLRARLGLLQEISDQVRGHSAATQLQGAIDMKQQEGFQRVSAGNIPLLANKVDMFQKQVRALGRAGVMQSVAGATAIVTKTERATSVLAAVETIRAIESLANTTQTALITMGEEAVTIPERSMSIPTQTIWQSLSH